MSKTIEIFVSSTIGEQIEITVPGALSLGFTPHQARALAASLIKAYCTATGIEVEEALADPALIAQFFTQGEILQ